MKPWNDRFIGQKNSSYKDLKNVIADLQLAFDSQEVNFRWLYVFTVDTIWFPYNLCFVLEWHGKSM